MAYSQVNLNSALTQCHYDQQAKSYVYNEISRLLQIYSNLSPKAVQLSINGSVFFILELVGTIPVLYQQKTYNIPIKIQIPPGYPNISPILIVTPSPDMMIKSSEYVQEDGKTTLDIQRKWNNRCQTSHLIEEAKKAFSDKMPVFRKPANQLQPSRSSYSTMPPGSQTYQPNYVQPGYNQPNPYMPQSQTIPPMSGYYQQGQNYPANQPGYPGYPGANNTFTPQPTYMQNPQGAYSNPPSQVNPSPNQANPPPKVELTKNYDYKKLAEMYSETIINVNKEIKTLTHEKEELDKKSKKIAESIGNFQNEINKGESKKELLRASICNVQEWIQNSSSENCLDVSQEDLIEYRNPAAREYLMFLSQEKALEATATAIIEAINKSVIPAKEGFTTLRQLLKDVFLTARLKEKAESLAKASS
ncbi:hypothetical protein SteCoe_10437 [Stentor coeruleus]|uniref:UEV domain-containing protein n=1 Tax=Stentor coeruleus TaxID=5963 RepID=A0A1R2CFS4_9CILI|nr:hypothetical protein SteCoe_10437 [Stentor coeruleus]